MTSTCFYRAYYVKVYKTNEINTLVGIPAFVQMFGLERLKHLISKFERSRVQSKTFKVNGYNITFYIK